MFLRYRFMFEKTAVRHTIRRWLTRWMVDDWVNTRFLFWSLNVCTTSMPSLLTWWAWYVTNQWLSASRTSYSDFIILRMLFEAISRYLINSTDERTKKSRFNDVIDWTYVWIMFLRYRFMFEKTTMRHTIRRWLTRWMIDDWVNIKFLFWSLNVCITSRDFSNALSMSKCLISSTNRELKMRTSNDTSFLFTDWKTSFSMRSLIFFCLDAANWEEAMCTIESNLNATASSEIEMRAKSTVVLNTKLKYAVDAKYFRSRSRSRLDEFDEISDSDSWFETTNWLFDWDWSFDEDIFDDFETNAMIKELRSVIEIKSDEFSRLTWSS
jgi:hypothetical protein